MMTSVSIDIDSVVVRATRFALACATNGRTRAGLLSSAERSAGATSEEGGSEGSDKLRRQTEKRVCRALLCTPVWG